MHDLTAFISREGGELVTDSRAVAIAFGKQHAHVMRTIKEMQTSSHPEIAEHGRSNFGESSYVNAQGKRQPMYRMTADGLSELAMSFSGDKARVVRIRFIAAFREVSRRLANAEKTITEMLRDYEKRAVASETKGRVGSMLMNNRRKEKPSLQEEEERLKEIAQPKLSGMDVAGEMAKTTH
jgi:Rha family phage regulatory protein